MVMYNVLITGANGFIGANLYDFLTDHKINCIRGTRNAVQLDDYYKLTDFIDKNKVNVIIHAAIEGGKRWASDTYDMLYNNLNCFYSIKKACLDRDVYFINVASGAEFNREFDIPSSTINPIPKDFYGLSKYIIANETLVMNAAVNVRLYGCFDYNEDVHRFIKHNIINYMLGNELCIEQNKYMDFIYFEDFARLVLYLILFKSSHGIKNIDACYKSKYTLEDVAHLINKLDNKKSNIKINSRVMGYNYMGDSSVYDGLRLHKIGLEAGIKKCYEKLR